jgi:hypothetical protein
LGHGSNVENLPSKYKVLTSNPSTTKKKESKKRERNRKETKQNNKIEKHLCYHSVAQ